MIKEKIRASFVDALDDKFIQIITQRNITYYSLTTLTACLFNLYRKKRHNRHSHRNNNITFSCRAPLQAVNTHPMVCSDALRAIVHYLWIAAMRCNPSEHLLFGAAYRCSSLSVNFEMQR